ncbi:VIT family protein [Niabella yanshanensis]|uniref:VIT family protein n=1 Tax=Niabella yanshanensis TaxID=577386 RepID=A0ABZ0W9P6_9BACT|nr:VIT family protein [Niabella yanshanensis]WQD39394.1 VIT family protein [Niabella yanshanensis]
MKKEIERATGPKREMTNMLILSCIPAFNPLQPAKNTGGPEKCNYFYYRVTHKTRNMAKKENTIKEITIDNYLDSHYINRSNWLRAAVLGANDGIISISSLAIGVAAASAARAPILLAAVAGLVAGALSMAAGEYVSVSSQTDIEKADIKREARELEEMPEVELNILAQIYERRGLQKETAMQVAKELTEKDALAAHVKDELGINEISQANPMQAALASGASFTVGGVLPLLVTLLAPVAGMAYWLYGFTVVFLMVLGILSAKTGGSGITKAILRITIWGTIAMGLSALVGYLFGVNV